MIMQGLLGVRVHAWQRLLGARLVTLVPVIVLAVLFQYSSEFNIVANILNILQGVLLPFGLAPVRAAQAP